MTADARLLRAVQLATDVLVYPGRYEDVLRDVLAICVEAIGAEGGTVYVHDAAAARLRFLHVLPEGVGARLPQDIPDDYGVAGRSLQERKTIIESAIERPTSPLEESSGVRVRSILTAPIGEEDGVPTGIVQLLNKHEGVFTEEDAMTLDTITAVATLASRNARLLEERSRAETLLGMGRVAHDIGNLAATLVAQIHLGDVAVERLLDGIPPTGRERVYAELIGGTFDEIRESVDRVVGYSRLISDMSAGRPLRPTFEATTLAGVVRDSAELFEADGRAQHVRMTYDLDLEAPPTMADPLYVSRIVQNLVGNAIKAVGETMPDQPGDDPGVFHGEVSVATRFDGRIHVIEVGDTGPGMDAVMIARVLRGEAASGWERGAGSGWGTRIVLELTHAHGGEVAISATPGEGTCFRVTLPHRPA